MADAIYLKNMQADTRQQVLAILACIPTGRVVSYGQVADLAAMGKGARQIGRILRTLPDDTQIPWHRVVSASGFISLTEPDRSRQIRRLGSEGVAVRSGRVDINQYRWNPPA